MTALLLLVARRPGARAEDPVVPPHRFELTLGPAMFPAALRDVRFSGSGGVVGSGQRATFSHLGREVGLRNPTFWGPELALGYRHTHFAFLVSGAVSGNLGPDGTPTDNQAAAQVGTGSVRAYGGAIELYGAVPFDRVTVSIGGAAGGRGYSMPMVGFAPTTCSSNTRGGRLGYPCAERATTQPALYVQPRLRVDVALDPRRMFFVGMYASVDLLGDRAFAGSVFLGLRLPGT